MLRGGFAFKRRAVQSAFMARAMLLGALLASLMIGELQSFGILWFPEFALVFQFLLMAVVLIVRPQGLFGEKG